MKLNKNIRNIAAVAALVILPVLVPGCSISAGRDSHRTDGSAALKVAACQFPVSADIDGNAKYIRDFIKQAAANKADVVQFCEAALSGYGGLHFANFDNYDWQKLRARTKEIMALAKKENIWVILGSAHYLCPEEKPTNCLYIISNEGKIVDRYDKSMCTSGDLKVYTPGDHFVTLELKGFKCGFLICYDNCFPEMYNAYRHMGVRIMLASFHNAHFRGKNILDEIVPAEIRVRASDNVMWVVASNSSAEHSAWPSCIARPDGSLTCLKKGVPGILYRSFPDGKLTKEFPSWTHNNKMMVLPENEVYHNGKPSHHPRAANRQTLP